MYPKPPVTLNKETIGVWNGWCNIGDKEVAREAAAKGLHVQLAIEFLSLRKQTQFEDAEIWFKEEIGRWVLELLERKQIFKASHVLINIGSDADSEFSRIFWQTNNASLREYLGHHLMKINKMDEHLEQMWCFLNLMNENKADLSRLKLNIESIRCLNNQTDRCKSEIATVLFLKTDDIKLVKFLNAETLWEYLVTNDDLNNILIWIRIRYENNFKCVAQSNLINQFKRFLITEDMLNFVSKVDIRNTIFNELSRFGVFVHKESNDLIAILKRFKNSCCIANINNILTSSSSTLTVEHFTKLLFKYCLNERLFSILGYLDYYFKTNDIQSDELFLIRDFYFLVENFNECNLKNNIFKVSNMFSEDITEYLSNNRLILLSLIIFNNEISAFDVIAGNTHFVVNQVNLTTSTVKLLEDYWLLKLVLEKFCKKSVCCDLTMYDLIDNDHGCKSRDLFGFRYNNCKLPHFKDPELVKHYGYSKKLGYNFYLKQSRPCFAAKLFILETCDGGLKTRNVFKLAIRNFECKEIVCGCIAFLEMVGVNSDKLRLLVEISNIFKNAGINNVTIQELLLNSDDEPYPVQVQMETILIDLIDSNKFLTGADISAALRNFEAVVQYSKVNNLKYPKLFLKHCASQNLWLPFLIFAQIHSYPLDDIKLNIQFFKSPNMLEHLIHAVLNDIQVEEKNILIRDRDSRKYLLSKVGVRKNVDALKQTTSGSIKSYSSLESEESTTSLDSFEIDISNIKATLLQTLIRCHNSTDPPKAFLQACQLYRNPLLAIFATSYEPDSVITNWLTWLGVSCDLFPPFTNYEAIGFSANGVMLMLENCLKNQFLPTLLESFEIFIPDSPLKIFIELLNQCYILNFSTSFMKTKLNLFQTSLRNLRKNSIISEIDHEMTYLHNRVWLEMTTLRLLSTSLDYNCRSMYDQILVVEALCNIEIWDYFSCAIPDFNTLLDLLKTLYSSNSGVKLDISSIFESNNTRREAVISCITTLLEKQYYEVALKVAQIESLPPDLILIKEWQNKMSDRNDPNFWYTCDNVFMEYNVTADCVIDFYVECAESLTTSLEKYILLKLAYQWAWRYELTCQYDLEKKMWINFLYVDEKQKNVDNLDPKSQMYLYKDLIEVLKKFEQHEEELNQELKSQIERVLETALNTNNFWLAIKLQKMFNSKNSDLEILKLCHSLAEGILLPHQLNTQQRLLISNSSLGIYRRTFLSTRLSSISSISHSPGNSAIVQSDVIDFYFNDTLTILKLFAEHLHSGVEIAQNIYMRYRISINIEIPYQVIVMTTDYMKMLKDALQDNCRNKIDVIHDFIAVYNWSKHEVIDFFCEEIINAISNFIEVNSDILIMWDLDLNNDFQAVIQFLQDSCTALGHKFYAYLSTLHKSQIESEHLLNRTKFTLIIELLIRAHDCFAADCNMEGISIILKKSKEVISNLLTMQEWKLIVRLLTGVARYTEMSYVFQILMENEQFEFLLRKGLKKDNALKVALLDYLKKFCPDNGDIYKIVALHFTLFSEVAMLWEREAGNVIKNLLSISKLEMQNNKLNLDEEPFILFQNTESTRICLNKAMENYTHATEFHLQGEKMSKALNSAKQAELTALQVSLLHEVAPNETTVCLFNLTQTQITELICSKLNLEQTLILVEAYNFYPDWASVLYEQYLIHNEDLFFEGFLNHFCLTDSLVQDISKKFILSDINSEHMTKSMKNILKHLPSVSSKYRIASELGFTDFIGDLIATGQLAYLKDTVWKRGYKS